LISLSLPISVVHTQEGGYGGSREGYRGDKSSAPGDYNPEFRGGAGGFGRGAGMRS